LIFASQTNALSSNGSPIEYTGDEFPHANRAANPPTEPKKHAQHADDQAEKKINHQPLVPSGKAPLEEASPKSLFAPVTISGGTPAPVPTSLRELMSLPLCV
jgi:hypothetical protein